MTFATRLAILSLLLCAPVQAQSQSHDVELATGLVCDTQQQVERFVALFNGDARNAASAVNAEVRDPTACAVATVAYLRGPQIATVRSKDSAFEVIRILVVGVATGDSVRSVTPAAYFTAFQIKEYAA